MRILLHVDMDAFFASVEQSRHPEWRGKPVIVGAGPHERGVVSTCSYEARRFGVHSAMPSRTAFERCPHGIFVPPDMRAYKAVSETVFGIFEHYTPYVEGVSIDEAFLDVTGSVHLFGTAEALAERLRREVRETCRITCSAGIAPNRLLAKIGSEQHKPDGLTVMPTDPEAIRAFLAPKPLSILWGVGAKTAAALRPFGLSTCGDVQRLPVDQLARILHSDVLATQLHAYAFGRADDRVYWESTPEKSVSREYTFDVDETDREKIRARLLQLVTEVGLRFRRETRWARTARIKIRDAAFNTITRQCALPYPARDDEAFRETALALFDREITHAVRLIGFGVDNISATPANDEPSLFGDPADERRRKRERLAATLDRLRTGAFADAFGSLAATSGTGSTPDGTRPRGTSAS